ncbi:MAG: glycosyltransferase [Tepidisphaera sp.]|nr:glycosyltransferase [Tepidisphaera sp.]
MNPLWLAIPSAAISALGVLMTRANLARFRPAPPAPRPDGNDLPLISVCIPARNEEANLEACVRGVLASTGANLEVLVYDDQSTDETPEILARLCEADARVRRVDTLALPEGWNGKQHACWRMAAAAKGQWLVFTDADVRFAPECLSRAVALGERDNLGLVSAFPRQLVGTLGEALAVPMIFFILLMYLPFGRMRSTLDPAASAACGQFLCVRRDAYDASGGHQSFKDSMHDGVKMPRAIRRAGFKTDLFDASDLLQCRMYQGAAQTWRGFAKNAFEGLGSLLLLTFLTLVHLLGYLLPWAALALWRPLSPLAASLWAGAILLAALQMNLIYARRLASGPTAATLLPRLLPALGVATMSLIQWHSYLLHLTGRRSWRGRTLTAPVGECPVKTA